MKNFGLQVCDHTRSLVAVDDPRLDALWAAAAEMHLPVLIHSADPLAFFRPLDGSNERFEELQAHPDWHFPAPDFPACETVLAGLANLVRRHPATTFIGAHVGCCAEDLDWVNCVLDDCPNFYIDISSRISELGRRPYTARRFFLNHAQRILFGTDMGADLQAYRIYYRFLETDDEYFNYDTTEIPRQGRWAIHGLYLPEDVLKKVYAENARHCLGLSAVTVP